MVIWQSTGYFSNEEATASTLDSQGWLRTGDLCYIDEDGFIFVVDRLKELIKYKGYQVTIFRWNSLRLSAKSEKLSSRMNSVSGSSCRTGSSVAHSSGYRRCCCYTVSSVVIGPLTPAFRCKYLFSENFLINLNKINIFMRLGSQIRMQDKFQWHM